MYTIYKSVTGQSRTECMTSPDVVVCDVDWVGVDPSPPEAVPLVLAPPVSSTNFVYLVLYVRPIFFNYMYKTQHRNNVSTVISLIQK